MHPKMCSIPNFTDSDARCLHSQLTSLHDNLERVGRTNISTTEAFNYH